MGWCLSIFRFIDVEMQVWQNGFNPGNAENVSQHQEHPKFSAGGTATRSAPLFIYQLNSYCITTCSPCDASGCCWRRCRARIGSRPCVNTHFSTCANCEWPLCQLMVCVWNCQPAYGVHMELSAGIEIMGICTWISCFQLPSCCMDSCDERVDNVCELGVSWMPAGCSTWCVESVLIRGVLSASLLWWMVWNLWECGAMDACWWECKERVENERNATRRVNEFLCVCV